MTEDTQHQEAVLLRLRELGATICEGTQAVVVARLKALPSECVNLFWRAFLVTRVRDFRQDTMNAVNQVLKNLEKEAFQHQRGSADD